MRFRVRRICVLQRIRMAFAPAAKCYGKQDRWFTGVVVTDGAGSPRTGIYESYTDEEMKEVRIGEQKRAAAVGGYSAQFLLGYPSAAVKNSEESAVRAELAEIIEKCAPETLYIHNFADKHDTHVATALRAAEAVRSLPPEKRPAKVYALEVWRGLDWLCDEDKVCFDTSEHPNLAAALLGVYDSQIAGGKRQMQHFMPAIIRTALKAAPTESTLRISSMERKRRRRSSARIFGNLKMKWGADSGGFHNAIT